MEKKIAQRLKGQFEYQQPELLYSQKKLRQVLKADETYAGEVYIGTEENRKLRGYVKSTNVRIQPEIESFTGTTVKIPYTVNMNGLTSGENVKGYFCFITNIGEHRLPFEFEVEQEDLLNESGEKMTLEEFGRLAKENFREAYRLFTNDRFSGILDEKSSIGWTTYLGMTKQPVTYQHLEEYLIASGLKSAVSISLPDEKLEFFDIKDSVQESFAVKRSGWGHLRMEVETKGTFLEVSKHVVTDEDFIGSTYRGTFIIRKEKLGKGKQYGEITLRTPYQKLRIIVTASTESDLGINRVLMEKKYKLALVKDYLDYRLGKLDKSAWTSSGQFELNQLKETGFDYPEYQLYRAYLLHCQENDDEARQILTRYMDRQYSKDDLEMAGFYLYVCMETGLYKNKENAIEKIRGFFRRKNDSFILFWILLQSDSAMKDYPTAALFTMEELFDKGCRSPLLYQEAWARISSEISLFHKLTPFWVQIFLFAAKHDLISEELAMRAAYLSGYEKEFSESTYALLCYLADHFSTDDILEAICKYITKGNPREKRHFRWFAKAIQLGLRLTGLYENYIETMDTSYQKELPKALLLYFTYNNRSLGDSKKAFIYACVIANKQKDPENYENYYPAIKNFANNKLAEGCMDENYAVIYQDVFEKAENKETADALASCMFVYRLYCEDDKIRSVIVRHGQMSDEEVYPCVRGVAYPRIYTDDAQILFQDEKQRRYVKTVSYNSTKLMDERKMYHSVLEQGISDIGVLLHYAEHSVIQKDNLKYYLQIAQRPEFSDEFRLKKKKEILNYYLKQDVSDEVAEELKSLDLESYAGVDKNALIQILTNAEMYDEALDLLKNYGTESVQTSLLMKVLNNALKKEEHEEDSHLVALAAGLLRKDIYNKNTLRYLTAHETGTIEDLILIWKKDNENGIDTAALEEKILALLIFTNDYRKDGENVFASYVKHIQNIVIASGYLTHICYGIFVKEYPMDEFIKKQLLIAYNEDWKVDKICHLTLLKVLAKEKNPDWEISKIRKSLLEECVKDKMTFAFFRKLPTKLLEPYQLDDKAFVEYHAAPEDKVTLYYALDNGLGMPLEYKSEPLHNMYEGICVKAFTLFYGETLHYYFKINHAGKKKTTSERVLTMNRSDSSLMNKYQMINQILSARRLDKKEEAVYRMRQYLRQEQYVREMFQIIDES
ncbi:MAG: DUF5717 family protein [Eubacteriales bacterium]|nr:DUF5717 family protein [Eubacteriales bacterium]